VVGSSINNFISGDIMMTCPVCKTARVGKFEELVFITTGNRLSVTSLTSLLSE
jgi:hypothetical protein